MTRPTEAFDELEPLTHAQRVQRMVDLGRRAGNDTTAASVLRQLEDGDTYARWLAVAACFGSDDADPVLRALADSSHLVRAWALRLVSRTCNAAQAQQAFHLVQRRDRKRLARYLVKHGRHSVVDAFLASFSEPAEPDFVALLPFATPSFVTRYLVGSMSVANRSGWRRLANSNAVVAADELERLLTLSADVDARLQWLAYAVVQPSPTANRTAHLQLVDQLLHTYRLDTSPLVAAAAQFTLPFEA